jgi:hypothetical protein
MLDQRNMPWTWPIKMTDDKRTMREHDLQNALQARRVAMFGHIPETAWRTAAGLKL